MICGRDISCYISPVVVIHQRFLSVANRLHSKWSFVSFRVDHSLEAGCSGMEKNKTKKNMRLCDSFAPRYGDETACAMSWPCDLCRPEACGGALRAVAAARLAS